MGTTYSTSQYSMFSGYPPSIKYVDDMECMMNNLDHDEGTPIDEVLDAFIDGIFTINDYLSINSNYKYLGTTLCNKVITRIYGKINANIKCIMLAEGIKYLVGVTNILNIILNWDSEIVPMDGDVRQHILEVYTNFYIKALGSELDVAEYYFEDFIDSIIENNNEYMVHVINSIANNLRTCNSAYILISRIPSYIKYQVIVAMGKYRDLLIPDLIVNKDVELNNILIKVLSKGIKSTVRYAKRIEEDTNLWECDMDVFRMKFVEEACKLYDDNEECTETSRIVFNDVIIRYIIMYKDYNMFNIVLTQINRNLHKIIREYINSNNTLLNKYLWFIINCPQKHTETIETYYKNIIKYDNVCKYVYRGCNEYTLGTCTKVNNIEQNLYDIPM